MHVTKVPYEFNNEMENIRYETGKKVHCSNDAGFAFIYGFFGISR